MTVCKFSMEKLNNFFVFMNSQIKQSRYPPAAWIHNDATTGAEVLWILIVTL
jgi:hypothetical protein